MALEGRDHDSLLFVFPHIANTKNGIWYKDLNKYQ